LSNLQGINPEFGEPPASSDVIEPVPAATVLVVTPGRLLNAGRGGLEVLMVRRPARGFFGGIWVFPGGVLDPGDHGEGDVLPDAAFRRAAVREVAEEVGIHLDVESFAFVSRWVTPAIFPRRYDTRFYLAPIPQALPLTLATEELEEASYITPAAALGAHQAQQWPLVLPTLAHLRWLARFTTIDQALASAKRSRQDPVTPQVAADGSLMPVDIPW
jgi:8-oxo-dGTP pyrophosphatase MutT (NUDIX family)